MRKEYTTIPYKQLFNGHSFMVTGHRHLRANCPKLKVTRSDRTPTPGQDRRQTRTGPGQDQDRGQGQGLLSIGGY